MSESHHQGRPPAGDEGVPPPPAMSRAWAFLRRLGPAGVLAVIAASLPAIGGFVLIGLTRDYIAPWLRSHEEYGPMLYAIGFAVLAGFALLPTYAQSGLGGFAFGMNALPYALVGFVGGSTIAYFVARSASGDRVMKLIDEHPKWRAVYDGLLGSGFWKTLGIITLLRIPPNSPFALTNLVMAATRVPLLPFLLGTTIGMAPRTAAVVYLGAELKEWSEEGLYNKWFFGIGVVVTLVVLSIIGHLANRTLERFTGPTQSGPPTTAP